MVRTIAIHAARGALVLVASVAVLLLVLLYTMPGHRAVSWIVGSLTKASITGLSGTLPDNLHADAVEVRDRQGIWLRAEDISLKWSALGLWSDHVEVERATAARVVVLRRPVPSGKPASPTPRIDVKFLTVPRVELAKPVAGTAAVLKVEGSLHYVTDDEWRANATATRLDNGDTYRLDGGIDRDGIDGFASATESRNGILGPLLGFPLLKPIHLDARADRANRVSFDLKAGDLVASGKGTIALAAHRIDIDVTANAPAMALRDDLSWRALALDAHVHGAFDAPLVQGKAQIGEPRFAGLQAARIDATVADNQGAVDLDGIVTALRLPGDHPDLFAGSPVAVTAHADLKTRDTPVDFTLSHALLRVAGRTNVEGPFILSATGTIPSVAPFAALADEDVRGAAFFTFQIAPGAVRLDGKLNLDGPSPVARLIGRDGTLSLRTKMNGADITDSQIVLSGAAVNLGGQGSFRAGRLEYVVTARLMDLSRLADTLSGSASFSGGLSGPLGTAHVIVNGTAMMASRGFAQQRIAFDLSADGFPDPAAARIRAQGNLDGAGILVHGDITGGANRIAKLTARWKSLAADAQFALPRKGTVTGTAKLSLKQLADIESFIGTALGGSVVAALDLKPSRAGVDVRVADLAIPSAKVDAADVTGTIGDPFGHPVLALATNARGIDSAGLSGDAQLRLNGPTDRIAIALNSDLEDARVAGEALLDLAKKRLTVSQLRADWRKQTLVLKAPATVDFAQGLAVDRFAAQLGGGELRISGRLTPKLDATVAAQGIGAGVLQTVLPEFVTEGTLAADARLSGTLDAPLGNFTLTGRGLRAKNYSSKALPPADLDVHGTLHGRSATVNATLSAGASVHLTATGEAGKALDLHVAGTTDLEMFNPILVAEGRQVRGRITMDMGIQGEIAMPRVTGGARLVDGELQDFARGAHVRAINATLQADGETLRVSDLSAQAGPGTVTGHGTIDLAAPGAPVDFTIEARRARPIASDLVTATLTGNLTVTGKLREDVTVAGKLDISQGEINLPERFPPSVAVLNVRRRGQPPPPPPPQSAVLLDITARTTGPIFVRGHGVDADFGGRIHVTGASDYPMIGGGFDMNRGTFAIAGQTLSFTTGKLSFDGAGIRNRLDPTLDFVAQTSSGGVTATLTVGGYASAPKITLSSSPDLPQDEVLAHLLFGQGAKQLTPLQLAQIAQALAALGGVGSGFDPVGMMRKQLGLDRLSVGSTTGGASGTESQTTVEAGKYVTRNVYVGAKQNLSGGTQVQVQVDLTKKLKAQATLATGTTTTVTGNASQDNGSSVGLSYEFEY